MRRLLRDCSAGMVLATAINLPAMATDLTLKRVALSSGGVGYLEYAAAVEGDATLTLDLPLDQIDDALKSLVVYDSGGTAGEITLPGREPLTQSFADLPFDQAALASPAALLNALQGSEIRISGDKPFAGRLLHADDVTLRDTDGATNMRLRLSLMTGDGLQQTTIRDLDAVEFVDPTLQTQVTTGLARIAAYRAQGRRQLTVTVHGTGPRTVRVGYVVAMPLWKATYRLVLPADVGATTARLQGWAVLENFSGQPWNDVELTLLSGNPVTFRQALYESYYVPRPAVPVEAGNHVLPPPDTGTFAEAGGATEGGPRGAALKSFERNPVAAAAPPPLPMQAAPMSAPAPPPADITPASAVEQSTQISFSLTEKVSVAAGQSLVVPLIEHDLPVRQVDLYRPATEPNHPLAAIELTNAAATGLPPGVLTLYQTGERGSEYLGDARLAAFPAGEKRLLSYAVDNKVSIEQHTDFQPSIVKATIAEGVMHLTRLQRRTTAYRVSSSTPPQALVIEQTRLGGWNLTAPDNAERTANAYRIPAMLDAKGNGTTTVVEEQPVQDEVRLVDLGDEQLAVYVGGKQLDPKVHEALAGVAERRQTVSRQQADLDRLNQERAKLTEDEERLRSNYAVMKDDPATRKRALDKLNAAETAIDTNAAAIASANSALATAQSDLAAYINGLKL